MDLRKIQEREYRKGKRRTLTRSILVVVGALILTTVAVDATDNLNTFSRSIVGTVVSSIAPKDNSPCGNDMTFVSSPSGGFCIDIYEASLGNACPTQEPRSVEESQDDLNAPGCMPVSKKSMRPWTYVSQTQAIEACARAGKHLPSNEEWFLASLGTPDKTGGWGADDCNVSGNWIGSEPGNTGSAASCRSSVGAYDMIGNVWEWTFETVTKGTYHGAELPDDGYVESVSTDGIPIKTGQDPNDLFYRDRFWIDKSQITGVFRGGFWGSGSDAGRYAVHSAIPTSFTGEAVGFRCAK